MKAGINNKDLETPYYAKRVIVYMEKILKNRQLSVENHLVNMLSNLHINSKSQTEAVIEPALNNVDFEAVERFLPTLSREEISARAAKALIAPLKKVDLTNPFGGAWNELTAKLASERIGMPGKRLGDLIDQKSLLGNKLRSAQSAISLEIEHLFRREMLLRPPEKVVRELKTRSWLEFLTNECRKSISKCGRQFSKSEVTEIMNNSILSLLQIIKFAAGQKILITEILDKLVMAQIEAPINVVNLHCMSFVNRVDEGITVSQTAEDFTVVDPTGREILVSQSDAINKVVEFSNILKTHRIPFNLTFLVFDKDKIVLPGQEENTELFLLSLKGLINKGEMSNARVVKASDIIHPQQFESLWQKLNHTREGLVEKIVDDEFERLKSKTLPLSQKSREFAREITHRMFLIQLATGATIPKLFDPVIILQRTRAVQQSSELFNIGAKETDTKSPLLIGHWKDRQLIQN